MKMRSQIPTAAPCPARVVVVAMAVTSGGITMKTATGMAMMMLGGGLDAGIQKNSTTMHTAAVN